MLASDGFLTQKKLSHQLDSFGNMNTQQRPPAFRPILANKAQSNPNNNAF